MLIASQGTLGNPGPVAEQSLEDFPGFSAYAATKAATVAFAKTLALEVCAAGLCVNALNPGGVDTPLPDSSDPHRLRHTF